MKNLAVLCSVLAFVVTSTASAAPAAATYECTSNQLGKTTLVLGVSQKTILVNNENYSGNGAVGTFNPKYKPQNATWAGCKKYDMSDAAFGEDGSTSILISKEMLAGKASGFAQVRNTWDTYTTYTLPCKRTK